MLARLRALAIFAVLCTLACHRSRPLELPSDVPRHACASTGVAACEAACTEHSDGQACLVASVAHGQALTVPHDDAAMEAFELRACDLGVGLACEYYANNFRHSDRADELERAHEYYDRACRLGRGRSCTRAGYTLLKPDPTGEPADARTALRYLRRACEAGEAWSCSVMGDLQTFGIGTAKNPQLAAISYRSACDGGNANGCHNAEGNADHWLSVRYDLLFERLHDPDPAIVLKDAPPGFRTKVAARVCMAHDEFAPRQVEVTESSGQTALDAVIVDTLQGWRLRTWPRLATEQPVCFGFAFIIAKQ